MLSDKKFGSRIARRNVKALLGDDDEASKNDFWSTEKGTQTTVVTSCPMEDEVKEKLINRLSTTQLKRLRGQTTPGRTVDRCAVRDRKY